MTGSSNSCYLNIDGIPRRQSNTRNCSTNSVDSQPTRVLHCSQPSQVSTEVRPPMSAQNAPQLDLHTRHRPVGATLSSELQTESPPVARLQGREEEGADSQPPRILFFLLYTRERRGRTLSTPPTPVAGLPCYCGSTTGLSMPSPTLHTQTPGYADPTRFVPSPVRPLANTPLAICR
jgi:hypothetical protein